MDLEEGFDLVESIENAEEKYATISDIYKELITKEELIIVIDSKDENKLRRGLSVLKAKDIAKMKEAGLITDDSKLEFLIIDDPTLPITRIRLQILLKSKPLIKIYELKTADGSLI